MGFFSEFKAFIAKGNVIDLAVAVVIGAAFGKIVTSLVNDLISPPLGILIGGVDFTNLKLTVVKATGSEPAVTLNYGNFIQTIISFIIIAFAIFLMVKLLHSLKRKEAEEPSAPPVPTREEELLTEIRDALVSRNNSETLTRGSADRSAD